MRQLRPRKLPKRPKLRRLFNAFDATCDKRVNEVGMVLKAVDSDLDGQLKYREFRQLYKRERLPGNFKEVMQAAKTAFLEAEEQNSDAAADIESEEQEVAVAVQAVGLFQPSADTSANIV